MGLGMVVALVGVPLVTQPPAVFGGESVEWNKGRMVGVVMALVAALLAGGEDAACIANCFIRMS